MHYIVFDLEFNQGFDFSKMKKNKTIAKCPFEIIQIGAVKLDENLNTTSTFSRLVKPKVYKRIHPFVKKITGITMDQVRNEKPFKEVYKEFIEFIKNEKSSLCVWGTADIKELFRNIEYHKLSTSFMPKYYINIQSYASKRLECPKGSHIGLKNAVELLDIPYNISFHDAFNDAQYTTEVFRKIFTEDIKPKIYSQDKHKNSNKRNMTKHKIDNYKLLKQFEKMFQREMTPEEQSIIKLAYLMGNTNQFQITPTDK